MYVGSVVELQNFKTSRLKAFCHRRRLNFLNGEDDRATVRKDSWIVCLCSVVVCRS
jgi:hypothetical protein